MFEFHVKKKRSQIVVGGLGAGHFINFIRSIYSFEFNKER